MQLITRTSLTWLRTKALRRRKWYTLSILERSVIDLTIRHVERVKSEKLSQIISRIICKILKALKNQFLQKVEDIGYNLVERVSCIASRWGHRNALDWQKDLNFIRYLGIETVNCNGWKQF
jgi:hypothetical protein